LQLIGEGGMGAVYMANQLEPIKRRVAVEPIREHRDSAQVPARFEAERQALALMDHPHIAKVLDAGTIDADAQGSASGTTSPASTPSPAARTRAGRRNTPSGPSNC
jgi:serine/threonine protein kinase